MQPSKSKAKRVTLNEAVRIHRNTQMETVHKLLAEILYELKKLNTLMEEGLRDEERDLDSWSVL